MNRTKMDKLLRPRSIAVIGASPREGNLGGRLIGGLAGGGYDGEIYAVHPRAEPVPGTTSLASIADIGKPVDFAALCVPDKAVESALRGVAEVGVKGVLIPTRAYDREAQSTTTIPDRLAGIAREHDLAICGHNCMGFANFRENVIMTWSAPQTDAKPGGVCIAAQSGSTWSAILGSQRDLAFDTVVSAGGEVATGVADYIEYYLSRPETRVIGLVVESIRDPERFLAALQLAERCQVPVVGLFVGLSAVGSRFTAAHSGGLSSPRHILDAIARQHGLIVAKNLDEFLDCLEVFRTEREPAEGAAGVVSDSGGERQFIADVAARAGLDLAEFEDSTSSALEDILDPGMVVGNPIDCFGDGQLLMAETGLLAAEDGNVSSVVIGTNLVPGRKFLDTTSDACIAVHEGTGKPVIVFGNVTTSISREGAKRLRSLGIPVLMGTETACFAIAQFLSWHRNKARRGEAIPLAAAEADLAPFRLGSLAPAALVAHLSEVGLPLVPHEFAGTLDQTLTAAERLGYPLVLKTANPDIHHKTEFGGVHVNLTNADELTRAYEAVSARCGNKVLLQPFAPGDFEIIVGMYRDDRFGPVLTVGLGGVFTEILKDSVSLLPPFSPADLETAIAQLRGHEMFVGVRGKAGVAISELDRVVRTTAKLALANPQITGIDLNPIIVRNGGLNIVDTLAIAEAQR